MGVRKRVAQNATKTEKEHLKNVEEYEVTKNASFFKMEINALAVINTAKYCFESLRALNIKDKAFRIFDNLMDKTAHKSDELYTKNVHRCLLLVICFAFFTRFHCISSPKHVW